MSIHLWPVSGAFVLQRQKRAVVTEMVLTSDLDSCPFLRWAEIWGLFSGEREVESLLLAVGQAN